jgi:hypothetical protein
MASSYVPGTLFKINNGLYFSSRNAQIQKNVTMMSQRFSGGTCSILPPALQEFYSKYYFTKDFFPNDPAITGVSSSSFQLPITVE